jgi:hypothetical protein
MKRRIRLAKAFSLQLFFVFFSGFVKDIKGIKYFFIDLDVKCFDILENGYIIPTPQ